jgi:DNA-binding transcriptional regulator PaaX
VATYFQIDGRKIVATLTRMGRKPLTDEDRRDKPFRIRMTDEERGRVDAAAEAVGDNSSSRWARRVLLEAAEQELSRKKRRKA